MFYFRQTASEVSKSTYIGSVLIGWKNHAFGSQTDLNSNSDLSLSCITVGMYYHLYKLQSVSPSVIRYNSQPFLKLRGETGVNNSYSLLSTVRPH